ncbi:MAG: hypothetical protein ACO23N_03655 [Opitutales bacterium]
MSDHRDFDALVFAYLDGDASQSQVFALRDALRSRPELRVRLAALVRLHRAQSVVLGRARSTPFADAVAGLTRFADRAGRFLAHACVLALVFVELDVAVPGLDVQAWAEVDVVSVDESEFEAQDVSPIPDEMTADEEAERLPDVREADFLES